MRSLIMYLATIAAVLASTTTMSAHIPALIAEEISLGLVGTWMLLAGFSAFFGVHAILHCLYVRLSRGPGFISWNKPSTCCNFQAWLVSDWNFSSGGYRHIGFRVFGLEVAIEGDLGS